MQKTIKINPELFTIGKTDKDKNISKNKSIKNRNPESASKNTKIKQKLLDKIKNFQKNREINENNETFKEVTSFDDSLTFLNNLSNNYHNQKFNKTLKSKNNYDSTDINANINTDLPNELIRNAIINTNDSNKKYGCLKNGSLPTFREWKRMTQKNRENINDNNMRIKINTDVNEYYENNLRNQSYREKKLQEMKSKFKETSLNNNLRDTPTVSNDIPNIPTVNKNSKSSDNNYNITNNNITNNNSISNNSSILSETIKDTNDNNKNNYSLDIKNFIDTDISNISTTNINDNNNLNTTNSSSSNNTNDSVNVLDENINIYNIPKIIRRTKTLKFKLGKSNKNRKIGVYIKNRETLKNIKNDFNKLKNVDINEVKKYLRKHNLINTGTCSPNDVLREIYEKAILSGEVCNKNTNNLLNNFINDD